MPLEIPSRPWERIGVDLFTFNNKDFLITVDYFSNYWEIDKLNNTSASTVTLKLLLNPDKTKFVIFGSRLLVSKVKGLHLSLLGKELTPAKSAKDLGVTLDSNLTYDDHVTKTISTCMSRLGQIN